MKTDTKTIHEFLAENPNVDVSKAWEKCWNTLSRLHDKVASRFPILEKDATTVGREYYQSPNKEWEGSMNAYNGQGMEWLVHSWLGNRQNSILDMNLTAFLGQETDVPHLVIVFGTIPKLFCYCDLVPRKNLLTDMAYLDKYYSDELNQEYLKWRGHQNFEWSVSHGTYMRAMASPVAMSATADLTDENIEIAGNYYEKIVDRWLSWLDNAVPVPEAERAELQQYDHRVRRLGYERDPMNALAAKVFGADEVDNMVRMRMGETQMLKNKRY